MYFEFSFAFLSRGVVNVGEVVAFGYRSCVAKSSVIVLSFMGHVCVERISDESFGYSVGFYGTRLCREDK